MFVSVELSALKEEGRTHAGRVLAMGEHQRVRESRPASQVAAVDGFIPAVERSFSAGCTIRAQVPVSP